MDGWSLLANVLAVLAAALVLGAVLQRVGFNALLGYLLAGVLLGPHATGVVSDARAVEVLAELGVGLLLFSIGLEFSWSRLLATGRRALAAGGLQVAATVAVIAFVARAAGASWRVSIVIGAALALSSTASVLRVLASRRALDAVYGRFSLGILLVQDVAVVPLVLLVDTLSFEGAMSDVFLRLGKTLGYAVALCAAFWIIAIKIVPRLLFTRTLSGNRELALLLAAVTGIGSTVAAHAVGLSPAVGAFVAGMLLAESAYSTQVRADVGGLRTLLVTIFFVSVGMLADPAWIAANLALMGGVVALIVLGKAVLIFVLLALLRVPGRHSVAAGLCLAQAGEFAFVLAGQAHPSVIDDEVLQLVAASSVATLFLTPLLVIGAPAIADRLVSLVRRRTAAADEEPDTPALEGHVIVVGLGPAGTEVVRRAREMGREVVVVELSGGALDRARMLGAQAILGDATYPEVLEHAHLESASVLVVTVPDDAAAVIVVASARRMAPDVRVLARARYSRSAEDLERAGAHEVMDEEHAVGRDLAELLGN